LRKTFLIKEKADPTQAAKILPNPSQNFWPEPTSTVKQLFTLSL